VIFFNSILTCNEAFANIHIHVVIYAMFCVQDLKRAFEADAASSGKDRLLLTAAVGAGKPIIDTAYDVPAISR
jgi:hypothetical protein